MDIIFYAIAFWLLFQVVMGFIDAKRILELKERVELIKEISDKIHQVKVEKIGGVEYWFDRDNDQFLGQGATFEEIVSHVKSRFPDHIFLIEGQGGVAKQTDWKLANIDEMKQIKFNSD